MEKSHINIIPKSDQTLISMNISTIDSDLLEKITDIIKRLFEIKRSNKVKKNFFFVFFIKVSLIDILS
jgi:hypothetical protein